MRRLFVTILSLILAISTAGQEILGTSHRKIFTASNPSFVAYTFVANTNCGGTCASITSSAITLTAGDFVLVFCRNGNTGGNAEVVTSSPANTWTQLSSHSTASVATEQASYSFGVGAGSTTFTCTPTLAASSNSMIVLQYHPGFLTALDVQQFGDNAGANTTTLTSATFTTTAKGLIIWCTTTGALGITYTAGSIGSGSGTLRGFSAASNGVGSDACEDNLTSGSQASITAAMSISSSQKFAGTVGAFK